MVLTFYNYIFILKNYNTFILYDYRYYCYINILINLVIQMIHDVSIFGTYVLR